MVLYCTITPKRFIMELDFDNKTPIYLQITEMIRQSILSGDLAEGDAIPSVRQVSVEYGLNPQTVLNATQVLIQEGIIEKRRGLGMFVKKYALKQLRKSESENFRKERVPEFVQQGELLGLTADDLCELIKKNYKGR